MQVIDADWQSKIELHIVTMNAAMDHALAVPPGDEHAKRWETYEGTCHDFLDHVRTHFNAVPEFDDFLKSQTREAFRISGYDDIPHGYWEDFKETSSPTTDAQNLASHYTHVFKGLTERLVGNTQQPRSNEPAMSSALQCNVS